MKAKSRKQVRKEFRKAKKVKKHEFFSKKKPKHRQHFLKINQSESPGKNNFIKNKEVETVAEKTEKLVNKEKKRLEFKSPQVRFDYERQKDKKEKRKLDREMREQRLKQLKEDNIKEDLEIRKLEKQLKLRKGKSKAFEFEGLDYLLDICDKADWRNSFEKTIKDSDPEFEKDLVKIIGEPKSNKMSKEKEKKKKIQEEEISEEEDKDSEFNSESDIEELEDKEFPKFNINEKELQEKPKVQNPLKNKTKVERDEKLKTKKKTITYNGGKREGERDEVKLDKEKALPERLKTWEDIYGRTRSEKGIVESNYIPPHFRKKNEETNINEKLDRLKKQLKGLLNRLAESNMTFISNQIEQLYMSNSRNAMNETFCSLFCDSLVSEVIAPERLLMEHALLIAVLHSNIGSEIGAHFLQWSVLEFCRLLETNPDVEDKRINNILIFILHLYNFQIFHSKLMYDLINELFKTLKEKQIELLLTTLRTVGFKLRKDDPVALKSLVLKIQERVNSVSAHENRVKFMLDILMAIKNNNMSKIQNYNQELVEKLRKNLKVWVRKGNYSTELNISLRDLLNAEKHGRWWIVGSAWSGTAPFHADANKPQDEDMASTEFNQKLLDLAKKQRMNTDVRRNIFCILMSAEDFLEAFEKLLKLKLKGVVEREIINVLLHCALQEKNFNPYYVFLANKFCIFDRKYQIMLQCAIWDRIKELSNALPVQVTNLAKFVGNIILEKGVAISILKIIQFSELDKPTIKFVRQVLLTILINEDQSAVVAVFKRIADSAKLKLFRESLRLFLQHFVVKNAAKNVQEEKVSRVVEMVKVAEQALASTDNDITF